MASSVSMQQSKIHHRNHFKPTQAICVLCSDYHFKLKNSDDTRWSASRFVSCVAKCLNNKQNTTFMLHHLIRSRACTRDRWYYQSRTNKTQVQPLEIGPSKTITQISLEKKLARFLSVSLENTQFADLLFVYSVCCFFFIKPILGKCFGPGVSSRAKGARTYDWKSPTHHFTLTSLRQVTVVN